MLVRTVVRLLLTIITAALVSPSGLGAETDKISLIRARYARSHCGIQRCRKVERDVSERFRSLEGDNLVAYLCRGPRRKIVVTHYWETGRLVEEYYYWGGQLFFTVSRRLHYNRTFGDVVRVEENRYYFAAAQLIRWVGRDGRAVRAGGEEWRGQERELLARAKELLVVANSGEGNTGGGPQSNNAVRPTRDARLVMYGLWPPRAGDAGRPARRSGRRGVITLGVGYAVRRRHDLARAFPVAAHFRHGRGG